MFQIVGAIVKSGVQPNYDEDNNVNEMDLEPIAAWKVIYHANLDDEISRAIPITTEVALPKEYAIYYSDNDQWRITHGICGQGLDALCKHYKEELIKKRWLESSVPRPRTTTLLSLSE